MNATPFVVATAPAVEPSTPPPAEATELAKPEPVVKVDPRFVKLNRELRDRYLERLNAEPNALPRLGKYDATRVLPGMSAEVETQPLRIDAHVVKALPMAA